MNNKHHEVFTSNAIDLYLQHVGEDSSASLKAHRPKIERYSALEDTSPPLTRILNWHFYRSNNLIDKPTWQSKTSERRLCQLCQCFEKSLEDATSLEACYQWVGRILHHIQDMSCPAHVIPIYHVKLMTTRKADKFEVHFDEYIDSLNVPYSKDVMSNLMTERCPANIYVEAAERMLKLVEESVIVAKEREHEVGLPLQKFWPPFQKESTHVSSQHAGFSTYGEFGNSFGDPNIRANKHDYVIEAKSYRLFYTMIYELAVLDSVKALHYLEQKIQKRVL